MRRLSGPVLHIPLAAMVIAAGVGIAALLDRATADGADPADRSWGERVITQPIVLPSFESEDVARTPTGGRTTWADEQPTSAPEPLTPEECLRATSMIRNSGVSFPKFLASQRASAAVLSEFAAEQASSEAWAAAGCPPDPARGKYPRADGSGATMRLYTNMGFSDDGQGGAYTTFSGP